MKKAGYSRHIDVASNRAGVIAGTHEVGFDSPADTITLRHTARSREGFALGAVKAAEWINGKQGGFTNSAISYLIVGGGTCLRDAEQPWSRRSRRTNRSMKRNGRKLVRRQD